MTTRLRVLKLELEERSLARALQDDVKAVDQRFVHQLLVGDLPGKQGWPTISGDVLQDRIARVCRLILKIQAGDDMVEQSARKHRDTDVWRLHPRSIEGYWTWPDGFEPILAIFLGAGASKS